MSVVARVIKTTLKDSDGKDVTFDTLAVNYTKAVAEPTESTEPEPTEPTDPTEPEASEGGE